MSVPICLRAANRVGREAYGFCSALWAARSVFSGGYGCGGGLPCRCLSFSSFYRRAKCFPPCQCGISVENKCASVGYEDLDGTVDYINRFTLEGGNPFLKHEKIHSLELMGAWRQFFAHVAYTYKKDPIMHFARPYGNDGEVKLVTKDNLPEVQGLQAFVGGQFKAGIWQPRVNVGIMKQWLTIDYSDARKSMGKPVALVQLQNAIHLPYDIWMNVDRQWMSARNDDNTYQEQSSYLNAKLYKAFSTTVSALPLRPMTYSTKATAT